MMFTSLSLNTEICFDWKKFQNVKATFPLMAIR